MASTISKENLFLKVFRFFASVKLAVFVLITLMLVLIAGTLVESAHGAPAAKLVVYDTFWFSLLILVLGLNVAAAAIDRLPWKKKHTGFVLTHAGIILILVGSFVTRNLMIDGQMAVAEGGTEHRITLQEPLLYVFSEKHNRDWIFPIKPKPFPWEGKEPMGLSDTDRAFPLALFRLTDYPKAEPLQDLIPTAEGPGAVKVTLQSSFMSQTVQLIENHPQRGFVDLGPARLSFTDRKLTESPPQAAADNPYLEVVFDQTKKMIPLKGEEKLPFKQPVQGTPYEIEVTELYRFALVEGSQLVESETNGEAFKWGKNPAAVLILRGKGIEEKHTVFANFPEFPTVHGREPSEAGVRIFYRLPGSESIQEQHELRFVPGTGTELLCQIQNGPEITTQKAEVGRDIPLGWMDFKFRIDRYQPHIEESIRYKELPNVTELETAIPVLKLRAESRAGISTDLDEFWLEQGAMKQVRIGGDLYHFLYGQRRIPAGFKLELVDFRIEHYPGTNRPASFESDVILKDASRGVVKETTISMNEPLQYRGFKIYQSGYDLQAGEPEVSVFSAGKDPGVPFQYFGTIVMVIGICIMYYTKRYSQNAGQLK